MAHDNSNADPNWNLLEFPEGHDNLRRATQIRAKGHHGT